MFLIVIVIEIIIGPVLRCSIYSSETGRPCNSLRPSVWRLSHGWISQKRCKVGSPNLYRRLPGRF